ncbi:MAG: DUF3617 domain-containing protein [Acidobacteriota bacterium]|jgi:hypothetical protein
MRVRRNVLAVSVSVLVLGLLAWAQTRKPGLWEVTSTMTWQQSPFPAGMAQMGGGPHTMQVCVTQAEIDKYGTVPPQAHGNCKMTNVVKKANGMTAEMVCSGPMEGKGTVEASWTDGAHSAAKVHFTGAMQMGPASKPFEWTVESTSVYKGPDCGSVKPIEEK